MVSPRVFQLNALPAPTDRQKTQMYLQRYVERFPAAGEIILFDRSWYNRAGVERVMGFCTEKEYQRFLRTTPAFEMNALMTMAGPSPVVSLEPYFTEAYYRKDLPVCWLRDWQGIEAPVFNRFCFFGYAGFGFIDSAGAGSLASR